MIWCSGFPRSLAYQFFHCHHPFKAVEGVTTDFPAFFQKLTKNPAQSIYCSWNHILLSGSGISGKLPWNLINQCGLRTTGGDPLTRKLLKCDCFLWVVEIFLHASICKVLARAPVHAQVVQLLDFELAFCWDADLFIIFILYWLMSVTSQSMRSKKCSKSGEDWHQLVNQWILWIVLGVW